MSPPPPLVLLSEVLAGSSQAVLDSLARIKEVFSYLTLLPPAPAVSLLQALLVGGWGTPLTLGSLVYLFLIFPPFVALCLHCIHCTYFLLLLYS